MDLKTVFLNGYFGTTEAKSEVEKGASLNTGFDQFLNQAVSSQKKDTAVKKSQDSSLATKQKSDGLGGNANSRTDSYTKNQTGRKDASVESGVAAKTKDSGSMAKKTNALNDAGLEGSSAGEIDPQVLEQMAAVLNVSVEQLVQVLDQMNIEPLMLLEDNQLQALVMTVLDVENPVDLLMIPDIDEVFEELESLISKASADFEEVMETVMLPEENLDLQESTAALNRQGQETDQKPVQEEKTITVQDVTVSEEQAKPVEVELDQDQESQSGNQQETQNPQAGAATAVQVTEQVQSTVVEQGGEQVEYQQIVVNQVQNGQTVQVSSVARTLRSNVNTQEVISQIVDKMRMEIRGNLTEMKITLRPDHLGELSLKISSEGGVVSAQFYAENQRVKEIIESNFTQLKDVLAEQGIEISELSVTVDESRQQFLMNAFSEGRYQEGRQNGSAKNSSGTIEAVEEMEPEPVVLEDVSLDIRA